VQIADVADLTDADLLRGTAGGDRAAFTAFVRRHEPAVLRYVTAITDDADRAADAQQETFIAAWRGAAEFRGTGSARAWLLRIARHRVYREFRLRSGQPRAHATLEVLAREAGWGDDSAERITNRIDAREQVRAGFQPLSVEDREILILRDLEEFSGEETAEMLGLSLAAQKSRLHRARLRFMAALKRERADGT
jgi:RNA polymerase sigma-70 factor, ECF subfamily